MNLSAPHDDQAMATENGSSEAEEALWQDLLDHLESHFVLNRPEAVQLVREVLSYFNEPLDVFVKRRHGELQRQGSANPAIFQQIARELQWWRLAAPRISERQIRRIIYG